MLIQLDLVVLHLAGWALKDLAATNVDRAGLSFKLHNWRVTIKEIRRRVSQVLLLSSSWMRSVFDYSDTDLYPFIPGIHLVLWFVTNHTAWAAGWITL